MDEKIIKINQNNFLVTTGDTKQITGNITKDELLRIYELRDLINVINNEINTKKNELNRLQSNKKIIQIFKTTIIIMLIFSIGYIAINIENIVSFFLIAILYKLLYNLIEKLIEKIIGTKKQNELDEKNLNISIEDNYEKLKEYEKELTEIIERTNYQEKDIEKEQTLNDLFYTEEEIRLYMQESPAPFKPETIFGNNEDIEEQIDSLQQSSNGHRLVRKRIPRNNNNNK